MLSHVGTIAGKVYQTLDAEGQMSMNRLKKKVDENDTMVTMAVGWLAREGKVNFFKERNALQVELTMR